MLKATLQVVLNLFICAITSSQCHNCSDNFLFGRATAIFSVVRTSLQCHFRNKTTEIPLKECSAYGQVEQDGGSEREENYIYEHPQY